MPNNDDMMLILQRLGIALSWWYSCWWLHLHICWAVVDRTRCKWGRWNTAGRHTQHSFFQKISIFWKEIPCGEKSGNLGKNRWKNRELLFLTLLYMLNFAIFWTWSIKSYEHPVLLKLSGKNKKICFTNLSGHPGWSIYDPQTLINFYIWITRKVLLEIISDQWAIVWGEY